MSCCGEPNSRNVASNQPTPYHRQPIDQQPGPHPGAQFHEKQSTFQQPTLTSPSPVHSYNQNSYVGQNGFQPQPSGGWQQHSPSPPPVNQFGGYPSPVAQSAATNYSQIPHQSLLQLNSVHTGSIRGDTSTLRTSTGPPISSVASPRQDFRPPSDEGK